MLKLLILFILILPLSAKEPEFDMYDGSAVVLDLQSSKRTVFGNRANERLSPCSTFKILNSMIALDANVIKDENETLKWDKVVRKYETWNHDQSMRSAMAVSAVWFYQEMARRIGEDKMRAQVKAANYGNMDISSSLDSFWLSGGSIKISLNEQVDFLSSFVKNELPFSLNAINTTKDIMTLKANDGYQLVAKTGSCDDSSWFVGFLKHNSTTEVFAFNIKGDGANATEAKRIALEYFDEK